MRGLIVFILAMVSQVVFAGLTPLPGSTPQTARANTYFEPVRVLVTDGAGRPVGSAQVSFSVYAVAGYIIERPEWVSCPIDSAGICSVRSDSQGVATLPPIRAYSVGTFDLRIFGPGEVLTVSLTIVPAAQPFEAQVVSGAGQTAVMGTYFREPISVRVTRRGVPVPGVWVSFIESGPTIAFDRSDSSFGFDSTSVLTGSDGVATTARFRAYSGVGDGVVAITAFDPEAGARVEAGQAPLTVVNQQGSKSFVVQDMWWAGPSQNGWGLSVAQHADRLFTVLFAYDPAGQPTWYVADGKWLSTPGGMYVGSLLSFRGAPYFAYDARALKPASGAGGFNVNFAAQESGRLFAQSNGETAPLGSVDVPLSRLDFTPEVAQPERGVSDMWWGGPSQAGWGLSIMEQKGNLFVTWFTYGADGKPIWFAMPEGRWLDAKTWTGPIYRTTSSRWFGGYSSSALRLQAVGGFTLTFRDAANATFDWQVGNAGGSSPLQRFDF